MSTTLKTQTALDETACSADCRTPIERMIDAATGYVPRSVEPLKLTPEQKEACSQLGRDVLSNLREYYPDVVKTRPTTWPIHLRNTIASKAEKLLLSQNTKLGCAERHP